MSDRHWNWSEAAKARQRELFREKFSALWAEEAQQLRDGGWTLQRIGDRFGVTRERVRQVTQKPNPEVQARIFEQMWERRKLLTPAQEVDLAVMAKSGVSRRKAAATLGIEYQTLRQISIRLGIKFVRARPPRKGNIERAKAMFLANAPLDEIASSCSYKNPAAVRSALHRAGVKAGVPRGHFANWKRRNPFKVKAEKAVEIAIKYGRVVRQPCEVCGNPKSHAHHDDYSKPLDVMWLCPTHHMGRHRELRRQELRRTMGVSLTDLASRLEAA